MTWKFMQIEPQPARGKLVESMWDDPKYVAEEKYDGDRRIAQFCGEVVRFTGRRISVKDGLFVEKTENVPHLSIGRGYGVSVRAPPRSLDGTVLDGEVIADLAPFQLRKGGQSKYVTSIMGSLPEEAVAKQIERGWLRYVVFDCLFYKGEDLRDQTYVERREHAERAVNMWRNPFVSVALLAGVTGRHKRAFYDAVVQRGGEGVILKHVEHRYGDKSGWVKIKKTATADVVIMGTIPAKEMSKKKGADKATITKYAKAGLIGAIRCGQYEVPVNAQGRVTRVNSKPGQLNRLGVIEIATVSGMDDELRAKLSIQPERYVGCVVEIEHNGREPTGRFRHPRFNRFRPDKRPEDCVMREDET